jgi:hypothetical protein
MMFARNARAHPNKAHKIWKGLSRKNTLAYHEHSLIMDTKKILNIGPKFDVCQ